MAKSTVVKTNVMGTLTGTDNTPSTPLTYACTFDMGDFSLSGLQDGLREVVAHEAKGQFLGLSYGARVYPSFSFSAKVAQFSDSASGTLTDFVLRTTGSEYAAAVSTSGAGRPFTTTWTFVMEGTGVGDDADHTVTLADCHLSAEFSEGDSNSLSISGVVYGAITGDLAQSEVSN